VVPWYRGAAALGMELTDYNAKKTQHTCSDMERVKIWNGVTASD